MRDVTAKGGMRRRTLMQAAAASALPARFAIAQSAAARTLRFVPQANLSLLDPIATTAAVTTNHGFLIYDTLFGVDDRFKPQPQMAEGYTVSDDGRIYLIRLRDGLAFHNGEPVRAQDCAASLIRWAARETIGLSLGKFVESWGVQDDRTIKLSLKQPLPILIEMLGRGGSSQPFILPEHIARTDPFKPITETIGSGPMRFVKDEYLPGDRIVYARNERYVPRQEPPSWTSGGKVMHFDRIEWKVMPDAATAAAALQAGEVDWYEWMHADVAPLLQKAPGVRVTEAHKLKMNGLLRFNTLHPPFSNPAARSAVLMAIDQTDYLGAMGGEGTRPCQSLFPCGTEYGHEADVMKGDLTAARKALHAAGYNGERIVIINPSDAQPIGAIGEVTADLLKRLGMDVSLETSDWGTVQKRRASRETPDKGGWNICHTIGPSYLLMTPVGHHYLRGLGSAGWFGWYKDDATEELTERWMLASDARDREQLAAQIQARAFTMVPTIPVGQFPMYNGYRTNVTGEVAAFPTPLWGARKA